MCAYASGSEMKDKILWQPSEEGFSVSGPGFPGGWSHGATTPEAIENRRDGLEDYWAVRAEALKAADVRAIEVAVAAGPNALASIIGTRSGPWRRAVFVWCVRVSIGSCLTVCGF